MAISTNGFTSMTIKHWFKSFLTEFSVRRSIRFPLFFAALTLIASQSYAGGGHPHGATSGHGGHDGHEEEPAFVYTHYTKDTELFVEFPPLVANKSSKFIAHFTRLSDFTPLTSGVLNVHLKQNNKTAARFRVKSPARTGIFQPNVVARAAGQYQLILELKDNDLHVFHDLGEVTVFPSQKEAVVNQPEIEGEVSYLKEQQWENPFAIVRAIDRPLRHSVPGFGTVTAPDDGNAIVRAPSDGYFSHEKSPIAGASVKRNQTLGTLVPRFGDHEDIGSLLVNQERARAQLELAEDDVERLQELFDRGAIPKRQLDEAKQNLDVARVEYKTNKSRLSQLTGNTAVAGLTLTSPITGELVEVFVRPGSYVKEGDALFTIADPTRRWLDVQIPEKFGLNLTNISGLWFESGDQVQVLDASTNSTVVKTSRQINPITRTFNSAIQYPANSGPHFLGVRLAVNVYIGEPKSTLSIPVSSVIDDGGQPVVYVQTGGESFTRKPVLLGLRDGPWVEILEGVQANDWVVSKGAYYVKLASTGTDAIGHGHAH